MVSLIVLITFDLILDNILIFWTNPEIQDGGQRWPTITQLLRVVSSSLHDMDVKENIFSPTSYPPSVLVIAIIFSSYVSHPPTVVVDQKKPA